MTEDKRTCSDCEMNQVTRPPKLNKNLIIRLNKIEGQVKGIRTMVENSVYCDDILIQIAAARSALTSVSKILLESHVKTCISGRIKSDDEDEAIKELIKTIDRLL